MVTTTTENLVVVLHGWLQPAQELMGEMHHSHSLVANTGWYVGQQPDPSTSGLLAKRNH